MNVAGSPATRFAAKETSPSKVNGDLSLPDDLPPKALFELLDEALKKQGNASRLSLSEIHSSCEIAIGAKLGIDATRKLTSVGFEREWSPLIRMSEELSQIVPRKRRPERGQPCPRVLRAQRGACIKGRALLSCSRGQGCPRSYARESPQPV